MSDDQKLAYSMEAELMVTEIEAVTREVLGPRPSQHIGDKVIASAGDWPNEQMKIEFSTPPAIHKTGDMIKVTIEGKVNQ